MELFDFIDALFSKHKYAGIPDNVKKKHFFMTQRFISIKYPEQANFYNKIGINQVVVIDFWHEWLSSRFTGKPKWIFTQAKKTKKEDKDKNLAKLDKIKKDTIKYFMKMKEWDQDNFDFILEIDPEGLYAELKTIQDHIEENDITV